MTKKIYVDGFVFLLLLMIIYRFLSNITFQVLIFENIHIAKSYVIKILVNIWNHGKNLQDLSGQNPC